MRAIADSDIDAPSTLGRAKMGNAKRNIDLLKKLLAGQSASAITDRIRKFRRLQIKELNDEALSKEILNVLMVRQADGSDQFCMQLKSRQFEAGTDFFRARKAPNLIIPIKSAATVSDAWAPPETAVRNSSRLNKPGESLLYTSMHPNTTLAEIRAVPDDFVAVFAFKATRRITGVAIGEPDFSPDFSDDELFKMNLINDFLFEEFTREVGIGTEHLYRTSEMIAKWWFDGPPEMQDAWSFPSVQSRSNLNVVFRPAKATDCLKLRGVMIGRVTPNRDLMIKAVGLSQSGSFSYFPIGSAEQKAHFPDIRSAVG